MRRPKLGRAAHCALYFVPSSASTSSTLVFSWLSCEQVARTLFR
ncbi:hypothetical protein HMPREF9336_04305 [Segniliparus rugosus ATCC BAA-974]|uniref:Uncharacterized protein n=1 Tax=Segniliparus rugosus (strain ATCC BAA-974 / DSM 45345 / CCUG 50838 / CIP 108380 / JCM 13579 / CDC 945) TaxID=679197 RepID=U1LMI7_SEGRC|nr:hypothetical protein HMPREF9336_04305 [Segniliparus rugosus ATCC BAA-974]